MVGGGIGGLVLLILVLVFGNNPGADLNVTQPQSIDTQRDKELADFVSIVLADTEDTWHSIFAKHNLDYREPTLVLFSGATDSGCGYAQSAMGPFYCPSDETVYIDLSFYGDLKDKYGAPGDFAQAYVIAHEVGHHVQNQLGIMNQVGRAQDSATSEAQANRLSVMLELQADCFAGIWANNANQTRNILEQGDIEEGLNAASSIGDDRLQMETQGRVVPDSFTHGTSAQRVSWFKAGFDNGAIDSCNTFDAMS
jgi:uncharacterized protein